MKTVVLSQTLTPAAGGAAVSEASLCASLQTQCTTVVLCRKGAVDPAFVRGFGLTDVKEFTPLEVLNAWRDPQHWLCRLLQDADVLHVNGHWRWENILLAFWCERRGIPYVLHPRGMLWLGHRKVFLKKVFNRLLGNRMVQHAARLIALSQFEITQWTSYGVPSSRILVIPNGIRPVAAQGKPPGMHFPYFLYFGRLESRKNLVFLVQAFTRYVQDGGRAKLLLVGPVERGYDVQLHRVIRRENLTSHVQILPPVYGQEKIALLNHATAVVYPSVGEPFGRVPFEALAAGSLPVVPVESGSAEYLEPYLPFSTYPIQDSHALLSCLRQIEQLSSEQRLAHLDRARGWVEKKLDWSLVTEQVLSVYRKVIAETDEAGRAAVPSSLTGAKESFSISD